MCIVAGLAIASLISGAPRILTNEFTKVTKSIPPAHSVQFFIGTYTSPGGSKGIYRATLNLDSGSISVPWLVTATPSPSYLAFSPGGHNLYAANELKQGSVSAYAFQSGGALKFLNSYPVPGVDPCHVSVDAPAKTLLVASYGGGILSSLPLKSNGALAPVAGVIRNVGSGPNKSRQDSSHMHWATADPHTGFVYSCDLGTDKVQVYRSTAPGKLTALPKGIGHIVPGGGPRHGAFHPKLPILYVNDEMGGSVSVFSVDRRSGALSRLQTISTLPKGESVAGNRTAEIEIHPSNRWLYVSNRGHDSIAVFGIGRDGILSLLQIEKIGIKTPRGFAIAPTGSWLVAAGQDSNDILSLKIDPTTGRLRGGNKKVHLSQPVCILFSPNSKG